MSSIEENKNNNMNKGDKMIHRFVIDLLKEKRDKIEERIRHLIQTKDALKKLRTQILEINRAIFVLIKDERNK